MRPVLDMRRQKHYVSVKEGAELYSMSVSNFRKFAREAHAAVPLGSGNFFIVDCRVFEEFLEVMREKG